MKYLNPAILKEKIGFKPHSAQTEVLLKMRRFTILNAGRRFGKSLLASYLALKQLLLSRKNIWIVAPSYDLSKKSFDYLTLWVSQYFPKGAFKVNFSTLTIEGPYGSKVVCKSAENPTSLLGESLDLLILDEASRIKKEIWESYLRPSLSDRQGSVIFISTPVSKENWFFQLFLRGKDKENKDWISFSFPSTTNPYLNKKDLEEAKSTLPKQVWEREYLAVFLDSAYQVFRNIRECISPDLPKPKQDGHTYILGIDVAKVRDFSVIVVGDRDNNEIVYFDRFSKIPYTLQKERILELANRYQPCRIIIDSLNVGGAMADELRLNNVWVEDFKAVGTISKDWKKRGSKERLVERLSQMFEEKSIKIPANEILIDELEAYGVELTEKGNITYQAPAGLHDDCVDALALCCWGLRTKKRQQITALAQEIKNRTELWKRQTMFRSDI